MALPSAYLALGCNRGDRFAALNRACALLSRHGIRTERRSSIYVTRPLGAPSNPQLTHDAISRRSAGYYFNAMIEVRTSLRPIELYWRCRDVEREMGRFHREHWEPRVMDIDLILFGDVTLTHRDLILPHPRWRERDFIVKPLIELGKNMCSIRELQSIADSCITARINWNWLECT